MPKATENASAEELANKMMNAVNANAWKELNIINWTFAGMHNYLWDKKNGLVIVKWGKNKVILNIAEQNGIAFKKNVAVQGEKNAKLIKTAYSFFCNDSWWLNPIVKAKDKGVTQSITDKSNELLVKYNKGGVTPGDAYLWKLDNNGLPISYQMWTQILPIDGIEVYFKDWITLDNGAKIALSHVMKGIKYNVKISDLKVGAHFSDFEYTEDPFNMLTRNTSSNTTMPKKNTSKPN